MNKARKVDLLYKRAKGQYTDGSQAEWNELKQYKVGSEGDFYVTRANVSEYVTAVDNGYRKSFYDWCLDNNKADRRMKGSDEAQMAKLSGQQNKAVLFAGWLTWGIALYWIFGGVFPVGICAVAGALLSLALFKCARKQAVLTLIIIPLGLAVFFGSR